MPAEFHCVLFLIAKTDSLMLQCLIYYTKSDEKRTLAILQSIQSIARELQHSVVGYI